MGLYSDFLSNNEKPTFKWLHYFPIYEKHLDRFVNRSINVLEIGVFDGGSLSMWRNYLGPHANIVGIDINPKANAHESFQISVEIGDQSDADFLLMLHKKYGPFDVVIDDGSHMQSHQVGTFEFFKNLMPENSVYIIEDTHTADMPGYQDSDVDIYDCAGKIIREISANYSGQTPNQTSSRISSISCYDSVLVFEFMRPFVRKAIQIGSSDSRVISRELSPGDF